MTPPSTLAGRLVSGVVVLAVVLSAFAGAGSLSGAHPAAGSASETLVVDNDRVDCPDAKYTSIQTAVTAAPAGATVRVCAGTYLQNVTVQTTDLTLVADGDASIESTGWILAIRSQGVTVRGFEINAISGQGGVLVEADDAVIRNNSIHGFDNSSVLVQWDYTADIINNRIDNLPSEDFPPDGITINGNATVRGNVVLHSDSGIRIRGHAKVLNNYVARSENGIDISEGIARIVNNTMTDNANAGFLVSHSHFNERKHGSAVVLENRMTNNREGVIIATFQTNPANYEIHRNVIMNNHNLGIENGNYNLSKPDVILNATNNYWACGGPSGGLEDPYTGRVANGSGDPISASDQPNVSNVHFDPFRVANPETCPTSTPTPTPSPSPTPSSTPTPSPTPAATATGTATPTPSPTPTTSATGTATPTPTQTPTNTGDGSGDGDTGPSSSTATVTTTGTPSRTPTETVSPTPVVQPGFGVASWIVGALVLVGLLALRRRGGDS